MTPPPTVLLALPTGHNLANLVYTGVVQRLTSRTAPVRVVALSPLAGDEQARSELCAAGAEIEPLLAYQPRVFSRVADSIASEQFMHRSRLQAVRLQRDRARLQRGQSQRLRLLMTAKSAAAALPIPRPAWLALGQRLETARPYQAIFERVRPDLVLTSTAGFALPEVPLIYEARRQRVPVAAVDIGWDNLSSKYHTILDVDQLAVWSTQMRVEAVRYHRYAADKVHVLGAPQFDDYFTGHALPARTDFLARLGAAPDARLVTLATAAYGVYPSMGAVVDLLAQAVTEDRLGSRTHLLVRVHPRDRADVYGHLLGQHRVSVDLAAERRVAVPGISEFDATCPSREDRAHLAATLAHTDVLINFASTTTIEACIFDTPVVNIGFEEPSALPLPLSIRRYFAYEHYRPVLEAGAVRVARSPSALLDAVTAYLDDPSLDAAGRRAVVETQCGYTDGCSADRLADVIRGWLEELPRPRVARQMAVG